jgi:hypothetical protein
VLCTADSAALAELFLLEHCSAHVLLGLHLHFVRHCRLARSCGAINAGCVIWGGVPDLSEMAGWQ